MKNNSYCLLVGTCSKNSSTMALFMKLFSSSSSFSTSLMLRLILLLVLSLRTKGVVKLPPNITMPAVFAFGDSIVDPGNNNKVKTLVKCNFSPYGKDFEGGIPTGRFSNGKIPSDLLGTLSSLFVSTSLFQKVFKFMLPPNT